MDRKEYNSCMVPHMKGGGPDRKLRFCIGAKVCSGKAKDENEARELCLNAPPKVKKSRQKKGQSCENQAIDIAQCVVSGLEENKTYQDAALNINKVGQVVGNLIIECLCPEN